MTVKEITKLFKDNGLSVDNYGLGFVHHGMQFGYIYKNGLQVCETMDADYRPWETRQFDGTEEEFVKEWIDDCTYNSYLKHKQPKIHILFECLHHMLFSDEYPNTKVTISQCTDGHWLLEIKNDKDLVTKIESICTPMINFDRNMWSCEIKKLIKGYLPEKVMYINAYESEFKVYQDKYAICLIPSKNTTYETMMKLGFSEFRMGCYRLDLDSPENYGLTWDDVVDVTEINGVLAVIYEQDGKLSVHPAFGGSGFAMDSYCHDLGTYGDWGDYTKIDCPSCNHSWYFNQRRIPDGEKYECVCPKCKMLLKRKKV